MARKWGEVEIDLSALSECYATLAVASERLAAVIQDMKTSGILLLHMENVVSLKKSAQGALSSARKAEDALALAKKMESLVETAKKVAAQKKGK